MLTLLSTHHSFIDHANMRISASPAKATTSYFGNSIPSDVYTPSNQALYFQGHPSKAATEIFQKIVSNTEHVPLKQVLDAFFTIFKGTIKGTSSPKQRSTPKQRSSIQNTRAWIEYYANLNNTDFHTYLSAAQCYIKFLAEDQKLVKVDRKGQNRAGEYIADRLRKNSDGSLTDRQYHPATKRSPIERLASQEEVRDLNFNLLSSSSTKTASSPSEQQQFEQPIRQSTISDAKLKALELEALEGLLLSSQVDRRYT